MEPRELRRGDVFYADLNPVIGSEQGGTRPVLVLQNDIGNRYSPTTIVAAITSRIDKARLPTHVELPATKSRLPADSVILLEQVRTIDRRRLIEKVSHLDPVTMDRVDKALEISLGLVEI
ncbi:MAG: type II toxin-antitoxin system PemK/MazF family toxin [Firmicutes bacterium]|jgi:mRNA interferase MazF|nr:type II toxin-antitoxin system PemK/MazF family toxin [Bacillota bacterium]MDH7494536.1 type II toxin-antitoxin system PemK/MazF family toxin [Bacillota bacterium]